MKMVRLLLVALLAAAVSLIVPTAHAETGQLLPAEVSEKGTEHTQTILNKVNNLRASLGLKPVTRIAELDAVAQDWSEQMAARKTRWSTARTSPTTTRRDGGARRRTSPCAATAATSGRSCSTSG
jgi:SCP-like extracellular